MKMDLENAETQRRGDSATPAISQHVTKLADASLLTTDCADFTDSGFLKIRVIRAIRG